MENTRTIEEPLEFFRSTGRVEESDGEKMVRLEIPKSFEGHTFCMHLTNQSVNPPNSNDPIVIDFVLGSEFLYFHDDINSKNHKGMSYLTVDTQTSRSEIIVRYSTGEPPNLLKEARITIGVEDGTLRKITFTVVDRDHRTALKVATQLVSQLLDNISFQKRIPIQIRHVEITQGTPSKEFFKYFTQPYSQRELRSDELKIAGSTPRLLIPLLRMYREALNSSKPHYRLLCLYKVREGLDKIKQANNREALTRKQHLPKRPVIIIPDNDLTRRYFPELIGRKVGDFLQHVQKIYRINVAHLNLNGFEQLVLDPAYARIEHQVDAVNAVLEFVLYRAIQDEWDLMRKRGLEK